MKTSPEAGPALLRDPGNRELHSSSAVIPPIELWRAPQRRPLSYCESAGRVRLN